MYQGDAEFLFPPRVINTLATLRGDEWKAFVNRVLATPDGSIEKQAFTLMMIRLDGCLTCTADSYRAMRGCTLCAQQNIIRFRGSDQDLIALYKKARADMECWHETGIVPENERLPVEVD